MINSKQLNKNAESFDLSLNINTLKVDQKCSGFQDHKYVS
jgi:hypothetical protein